MAYDTKTTWDACGAAFDRYTSTEDSFSENIERPVIEALFGDLMGASALDLGCGSGVYATRLAACGARVVGVDLSAAMLDLARERARLHGVALDLLIADIARPLPFADAQFDLLFTATALHYVEDLGGVMREMARLLRPQGRLIASLLHPMSTARFPLHRSEDSNVERWEGRAAWPAHYFGAARRRIETPWLGFGNVSDEGQRLDCFHHTVSDYFAAAQSAGLHIKQLREPAPPAAFAAKNAARYEEAISLPLYLIIEAAFK
ncbi:MAG: class I SAM-dependent methyltransferase [Blastocatellia bacterium]